MRTVLLISLLIFLSQSCQSENELKPIPKDWSKEKSIEMNSTFSNEEEDAISSYLKRRPDWKTIETGTGLRYFIYKTSGNSDSAVVGDNVTVSFSISLLNGQECYNSIENGPETFTVEKTDIESGLHEAVKLMKLGDKARIILPSHLAHGLIGDRDKIPPLETVIYDLHLLQITHNYEH